MSESDNDKLKSIGELLGYSFTIPSYQRGYRWDTGQVLSILTDIEEFGQIEDKARDAFYCLQPLVLKQLEDTNKYELIDGQQRLTTIYLILVYFQNNIFFNQESYLKEGVYSISYETRDGDEIGVNKFLQKLPHLDIPYYSFENDDDYSIFDDEVSKKWKNEIVKNDPHIDTVDNFYIYRTYSVIKNWFSQFEDKGKWFVDILLEQTKVIWYVEEPNSLAENSIKKFINFNEGRIELEQSELIKALFVLDLKDLPNVIQRQYEENQFADEWNQIEHQMGDKKFWQFVSNNKNDEKIANKINLLFQLYNGFGKTEDYFYNYREIDKAFKSDNKPKWQNIVGIYNSLEEWYFDRTSFHLVGAIIHLTKSKISDVVRMAKDSDDKLDFRNRLRKRIRSDFKTDNGEWREKINPNKIKYGDKNVFKLLLLYNIALTQIDEVDSFFPFHRFYNEGDWSIEHILAQNDDGLDDFIDFENFYKETIELIDSLQKEEISDENKKLIKQLCNQLSDDIVRGNKSESKKTIKEINEKFNEFLSIDDFNNLCLLDQSTNSKIGKNRFKRKRNIILKMDKDIELKSDAYIPIGTQYVFSKNSTPSENYQVNYWSQQDKKHYLEKVEKTINQFLKEESHEKQ